MTDVSLLITLVLLLGPLLATAIIFGSILDRAFSKYSLRTFSAVFFVLALSFLAHSGFLEEALLVALNSPIESSANEGVSFALSLSTAVVFCSFVAGGVLLSIIAVFEGCFAVLLGDKIASSVSLLNVLRPCAVITVLILATNLLTTFLVDRLQPLSILRILGS